MEVFDKQASPKNSLSVVALAHEVVEEARAVRWCPAKAGIIDDVVGPAMLVEVFTSGRGSVRMIAILVVVINDRFVDLVVESRNCTGEGSVCVY